MPCHYSTYLCGWKIVFFCNEILALKAEYWLHCSDMACKLDICGLHCIFSPRRFGIYHYSIFITFCTFSPSQQNWKNCQWKIIVASKIFCLTQNTTFFQITELFTTQYFPNLTQAVLDTKLLLLVNATNKYCGSQPLCLAPGADRPVTTFSTKTSVFYDTGYVFCKPGFTVVSCGISYLKCKFDSRRMD